MHPAERDLGFPYTTILGEPVASYTLKEFSGATFLGSKRPSYRDWMDGGRRPPTHEDFSAYLAWSVKKSGANVIKAKVGRLAEKSNQWEIRFRAVDGALTTASKTLFDGVVVTGPGPARGISQAGQSERVFNGIDFWKRTSEIRRLLPGSRKDGQIAIIGAGGTAAAVLAWLCKNGHRDREIFMIADQGALYTRGESVFENRLFSDDEAWNSLSPASKREFFDRLNRGVVWGTVMNEVATASRVRFQNGRATRVTPQSTHVEVTVRRGDAIPVFLRPEVLIDAAGFESWWFLDLLTGVPAALKKSTLYDQWMRKNPKQAAAIGTRWVSGLKLDVAETAMQYNIQQMDRRISAHAPCTLKGAGHAAAAGSHQDPVRREQALEPKYILKVMQSYPALSSDLQPIPADVTINPGFVFKP